MNLFSRISTLALATISLAIGFPACSHAETNYSKVSMYVANMLQIHHYSRMDFDDDVSKKLLKTYLGFLDYNRLYFTQSDIDKFEEKYGTKLDEIMVIEDEALQPAKEIYKVYEMRVAERIGKLQAIIDSTDFKFDSDRSMMRRREDAPWAKDAEDADKIWGNIVEGQMLEEHLAQLSKEERYKEKGKELPKEEKSIQEIVFERYDRFAKSLESNDQEDICNFFLSALSQVYDPHSEYFSYSELENFQNGMRNFLYGIGALLRMDDGAAMIEGIVVGGPAAKQGELQLGDRIVGVAQGDSEMVDILYMKLQKIVDYIRGEEGSTVRLKVIPADGGAAETKEIVIVRQKVDLKEKLANAKLVEMKDAEGKSKRIGWINLYSFYADMQGGPTSTTKDVRLLLDRLMKEGMQGLVLDLRGNGGGSLEEAINLTGLFIKRGPVVQAKDWHGKTTFRKSDNRFAVYKGPMIVLTDRSSASASEILAAALQDYNRAVIVGDKSSFGKGTVQTIMPVSRYMPLFADTERAGALKVTIQKFYRIAGGSTQLRGVVPDIILPSYTDALETGEESLDYALPYDEIEARKYDLSNESLPSKKLGELSAKRIAGSKEYQYMTEDIARLEKQEKKNDISLNLAERRAETTEFKTRRKTRNIERRERFAELAKEEVDRFKVFRLTLDNVEAEELTLAKNGFSPEDDTMLRKKNEDADLDDTPEHPNGLKPMKREALDIMSDMIDIEAAQKTAKVEKARSAG
ncbi:MAG: carboxyl-terminal processing protease [Verrucomicrobiales bacterium]|jgi:carboxyl-terminal processing protease